jgi:hypothetical protein
MTGTLTDTAKDLREQATERLSDTVETVRPRVAAALVTAKDALEDLVEEVEQFVEHTALPALSDAGEQARKKALPVVATGAAYAAEKATLAKQAAVDKADEITGKKKRRRRNRLIAFLGFAVLAAIAGVVARKMLGGSGDESWQAPSAPPITPVLSDEPDTEEPTARHEHGDSLTDPLE